LVTLAAAGCTQRPPALPQPGIAVGDVLLSIDHRERLDRRERSTQRADPLYTLMVSNFHIERRADQSAWLWLDDEHAVQLMGAGPVGLAAAETGEWCLTPRMLVLLYQSPGWFGEPLGAMPGAVADYLREADAPARDRAADLAAYLLGRNIVPYHVRTRDARISGRLRLSEEGRQKLLHAVAAYYAHLRGLEPI
jgi:hypothetical protein